MERVVLAYSGGLDTSVLIPWLREHKSLSVIAFSADLGQGGDLEAVSRRALDAGAESAFTNDLTEEFASEYIARALKANATYGNGYLLATALGRPLIAKMMVQVAEENGARYVAHGCTGKGNDQVRFEASIAALAPELKILAPVRTWELDSREAEIDYLQNHQIPLPVKKDSPYSLDANLWGVAIECGDLEDPWVAPPDDAWQTTTDPLAAPDEPIEVTVGFERGVPVSIDGKAMELAPLIRRLNELAAAHGIGRTDCVEDRVVGIKSREVYEAPGATVLYAAHRALEALTLSEDLLNQKAQISQEYARLIYDGLWFSHVREALDAFIDKSQEHVTGEARVRLYKGSATVVGRRSPASLYSMKLATYTAEDAFNHASAAGFIDIWSLPIRAEAHRKKG